MSIKSSKNKMETGNINKAIYIQYVGKVRPHEISLINSFETFLSGSHTIESIKKWFSEYLIRNNNTIGFGRKLEDFYDVETTWYQIAIFRRKKNGHQGDVFFKACLSGMQDQ